MPDISLRLHKDMLVLSAPLEHMLARQGVDAERDLGYHVLMEPETLVDALRMEILAGAQCVVAPTCFLAPARLAALRMDGDGSRLARAACALVAELPVQHVFAEIGPCGLPLDPSSKASLNENRDQYARAARCLADEQIDAFFLNGFRSEADLRCALMGIAQVDGRPVAASVDLDGAGALAGTAGRETLEHAGTLMADLGATVAGFATAEPTERACRLAHALADASGLPVMAQLVVEQSKGRSRPASPGGTYGHPDSLVEAAVELHGAGAQFLRAVGAATSAHTGALAATVSGLDVRR